MTRKIIVVEDEEILSKLIKKFISMSGFECEVFMNASEARGYFKSNRNNIHLAIIDINLAGVSGMDLVSEFRAKNPNIKIVISSGDHYELEKIQSTSDINGILHKPFNLEDFSTLLKNILD